MRTPIRPAAAAAAAAAAALLSLVPASAAAAGPATVGGKCVDVYVQTNPPTGATVCTPEG